MKLRKMQQHLVDTQVKEIVWSQPTPRTTFCVLIMHDGWEVFGNSSCNSSENYDAQHGKDLSLLHALARLKEKIENRDTVRTNGFRVSSREGLFAVQGNQTIAVLELSETSPSHRI